ncbi:hypothetical protein [Halarchaeum acidiphilum]|nr:hypothetical protein [Halarchaeum acidiphilum]
MKAINDGYEPGLPSPPISADDVDFAELPTVPLDEGWPALGTTIREKAKWIAEQRNQAKDGDGSLYGSRGATEAHEIGYIGEIVVSQQFITPRNEEVNVTGDAGWDHVLADTTIDTKTTTTDTERPKLIVSARDTPPADYFVLVHVRQKEDIARVIGFAHRATVVDVEPEEWPGSQPNHVLDLDALYPPRYWEPIVMPRAILESEDRDYVHETGCQLCGAHLELNQANRMYIAEGLERAVTLCDNYCTSLLKAAREEGRATEIKLYERPPV